MIFDPLEDFLMTVVVEASYQDMLSKVENARDCPLLREAFALSAPALLGGSLTDIVKTMTLLQPVIAVTADGTINTMEDLMSHPTAARALENSQKALDDSLNALANSGVSEEALLATIESLLDQVEKAPKGVATVAVLPLDPDQKGDLFVGSSGDAIPSDMPPEIQTILKGLGLVEGEVLKDNMPADLPLTVKVKDDVLN